MIRSAKSNKWADHATQRAKPFSQRFWEKVDIGKENECWPWQGCTNEHGYGRMMLKGKRLGSNRISWELSKGEIPKGLCVLHRCDFPSCCNPSHLFLGTHKDNMADMAKKGRHQLGDVKGTKNGMSKLNEHLVRAIRIFVEHGLSQTELANHLGVSVQCVNDVVLRRNWGHVD